MRLSGRVYRSTWNSPSACYQLSVLGQFGSRKRTLNVILGIRVWCFIVVYHLHDLEKVIFSEALESICQFVHVDLYTFVRPRILEASNLGTRDSGVHSSPCVSSF